MCFHDLTLSCIFHSRLIYFDIFWQNEKDTSKVLRVKNYETFQTKWSHFQLKLTLIYSFKSVVRFYQSSQCISKSEACASDTHCVHTMVRNGDFELLRINYRVGGLSCSFCGVNNTCTGTGEQSRIINQEQESNLQVLEYLLISGRATWFLIWP